MEANATLEAEVTESYAWVFDDACTQTVSA